jgi:hypothetical protein
MDSTLRTIRDAAAPFGLNLVAAIAAARYDAIAAPAYRAAAIDPRAQSIVVIANGGGAFWRAFLAYSDHRPGWRRRPNPLDDFTRVAVDQHLLPALDNLSARVVYPFMTDSPTLNFMELGKIAGIAGPSLLGVVINPTYGPWIAFRAAILLDRELDSPGPALNFDPCPSCIPKSCIDACPVNAIHPHSGWDIPRCLIHRVEQEPDCAPRCHARTACVIGPEHRYPDDELAYHQERAMRAMRPYYETRLRPQRGDKS